MVFYIKYNIEIYLHKFEKNTTRSFMDNSDEGIAAYICISLMLEHLVLLAIFGERSIVCYIAIEASDISYAETF